MVLRGSTDEGHAANVNVFNGVCVGDVGFSDSFLQGIEVYDDQIDEVPAEAEELLMIFVGGASEESTMDGGMEGLNSSTQNFGRLGIVRDFGDRNIVLT